MTSLPKCIIQEKNANVDVEIIRQDRAISYRVRPRKILETRGDAVKWKHSVTGVEDLIKTALERDDPQLHGKVNPLYVWFCS